MAFLSSFDICASGMSAQRLRMDIAAENVANMTSTRTEAGGTYRRKDVVLESYGGGTFQDALRSASRGMGFSSGAAGVRVAQIIEDDREFKRVYNPEHPDADEEGYVSMPNVDVLKETVDSMSATRSYEANVTALNAIGEIMNISLGASATAISTLLGTKVNITTPVAQVLSSDEFSFKRMEPAVGVDIAYVKGLSGSNVMIFRRNDVRVIVGIMMGMEIPEEEFELDEMNISAVC